MGGCDTKTHCKKLKSDIIYYKNHGTRKESGIKSDFYKKDAYLILDDLPDKISLSRWEYCYTHNTPGHHWTLELDRVVFCNLRRTQQSVVWKQTRTVTQQLKPLTTDVSLGVNL